MQLLFVQQWIADNVLRALGWTFLHSLWQGLLAAVVVAIIISATKRSVAQLRYNLLGIILCLFLLGTVFTFYAELNQANEAANAIATTYEYSSIAGGTATILQPGWWETFMAWFDQHANVVVMVWIFFFILHSLKLITGLASIHRLKHYKTHNPSDEWKDKFLVLANRLRMSKPVILLQSELVKMPVAIGYLKPVILVPLGLLARLPADQVETILLHELAHIRRRDYLVNLVQRLAESVFFFNPAFLWISSLLRHEREACCDDIVVANTTHKRTYLDALISFQEYSFASASPALAISNKKYYLLNRVKRILTMENQRLNWSEKMILVLAVFIFSAFTVINQKEKEFSQTTAAAIGINDVVKPGLGPVANLQQPKSSKKPGLTRINITANRIKPADTMPPKRVDRLRKKIHNVQLQESHRNDTIKHVRIIAKDSITEIRLNHDQQQIQKEKIALRSKMKTTQQARREAEQHRKEELRKIEEKKMKAGTHIGKRVSSGISPAQIEEKEANAASATIQRGRGWRVVQSEERARMGPSSKTLTEKQRLSSLRRKQTLFKAREKGKETKDQSNQQPGSKIIIVDKSKEKHSQNDFQLNNQLDATSTFDLKTHTLKLASPVQKATKEPPKPPAEEKKPQKPAAKPKRTLRV